MIHDEDNEKYFFILFEYYKIKSVSVYICIEKYIYFIIENISSKIFAMQWNKREKWKEITP